MTTAGNKKLVRRSILGNRIFYNCPKCGKPIEYRLKKHKYHCMHCGQELDWNNNYDNMSVAIIWVDNAEDAYFWAKQYAFYNGDTYELDPDQWRLLDKRYPLILYFPFPEGKAYGRFVREATMQGAKMIISF